MKLKQCIWLLGLTLGSWQSLLAQSGNFQREFSSTVSNFLLPQAYDENISVFKFDFFDIDSDGDLDLFTSNEQFFLNIGTPENPHFVLQITSPFDSLNYPRSASAPTFIDIDNDGDADLAMGDSFLGCHNGHVCLHF